MVQLKELEAEPELQLKLEAHAVELQQLQAEPDPMDTGTGEGDTVSDQQGGTDSQGEGFEREYQKLAAETEKIKLQEKAADDLVYKVRTVVHIHFFQLTTITVSEPLWCGAVGAIAFCGGDPSRGTAGNVHCQHLSLTTHSYIYIYIIYLHALAGQGCSIENDSDHISFCCGDTVYCFASIYCSSRYC
eukprot:COSAG05_NODE_1455_length_4831_cov_1.834954_6_plen_188_part_00